MNKVFFIGNLTRDPESRTSGAGNTYVTMGVAVNIRGGKQQQEETIFYNVTVLGRQCDFCLRYLTKGRRIVVTGNLSLRLYDRNDGTKAISADVLADDVQTVGAAQTDTPGSAPATTPFNAGPTNMPGGFAQVEDDDLPF